MTIAINTENIPDRADNEDEGLILLALRRVDPVDPGGSPLPDIASTFTTPTPAFIAAAVAFCIDAGFDPSLSYISVVGLTDVEQGGAITLADLQATT